MASGQTDELHIPGSDSPQLLESEEMMDVAGDPEGDCLYEDDESDSSSVFESDDGTTENRAQVVEGDQADGVSGNGVDEDEEDDDEDEDDDDDDEDEDISSINVPGVQISEAADDSCNSEDDDDMSEVSQPVVVPDSDSEPSEEGDEDEDDEEDEERTQADFLLSETDTWDNLNEPMFDDQVGVARALDLTRENLSENEGADDHNECDSNVDEVDEDEDEQDLDDASEPDDVSLGEESRNSLSVDDEGDDDATTQSDTLGLSLPPPRKRQRVSFRQPEEDGPGSGHEHRDPHAVDAHEPEAVASTAVKDRRSDNVQEEPESSTMESC